MLSGRFTWKHVIAGHVGGNLSDEPLVVLCDEATARGGRVDNCTRLAEEVARERVGVPAEVVLETAAGMHWFECSCSTMAQTC